MLKMKVTNERLPTRCEICHQSDCFDARQNHCRRCGELYRDKSTAAVCEPVNELMPALTERLGSLVIFLLVEAVTILWGTSIGMAVGAILEVYFQIELIAIAAVLAGAIAGLVWGSRIGQRAVAGKYRAFYEINT